MDAPLEIRGRAVLAPLMRAEGQEMIRWFMMKRVNFMNRPRCLMLL
jgi:hypothetical protein